MNATQPSGKVARTSAICENACDTKSSCKDNACCSNVPSEARPKNTICFEEADCRGAVKGDPACAVTRGQKLKSPTLARVLAYENNAVVARIKEELELTEEAAKALFADTLKFLWLTNEVRGLAPSPIIDEGWHTFILFMMDYSKFCHKYFGRLIYHRPRRPEDPPDGGKTIRRTIAAINQFFPSGLSDNWKYEGSVKVDCDCDHGPPSTNCQDAKCS